MRMRPVGPLVFVLSGWLALGVAAPARAAVEAEEFLVEGDTSVLTSFREGPYADAVRKHFEKLLNRRIELLQELCRLNPVQEKRLRLAGRGDIKRLFDEIAELAAKQETTAADRQRINHLSQDLDLFSEAWRAELIDRPRSLFDKTIQSVLKEEQAARYDRLRPFLREGARVRILEAGETAFHVSLHGDQNAVEKLTRIGTLEGVRALDLSSAPLDGPGLGRLTQLKGLSDLRWLKLVNTQTGDDGLKVLKELTGLEVLDLDGTPLTDAGLASLQALGNLELLSLGGTSITDKGLAALEPLQKLQTVALDGHQITDGVLEQLARLRNIRSLSLAGSSVTPVGLAHLERMTRLRQLDLSGTPLTDDGAALLKGHTSLEELSLGGTLITDAGLEAVSGLVKLKQLDLRRTKVTDAGLARLKDLAQLEGVFLEETATTAAGVAEMQRTRPRLQILR